MNNYKFEVVGGKEARLFCKTVFQEGADIHDAAIKLGEMHAEYRGATVAAWYWNGDGYTINSEIQRGAFIGYAEVPAPAPVPTVYREGQGIGLYANQGVREAVVLAVRGADVLAQYDMPAGRKFLRIFKATDNPRRDNGIDSYKTTTFAALPRKFRTAPLVLEAIATDQAESEEKRLRWMKQLGR